MNLVNVANIFTEMEVLSSEKKEAMRIAGELVSTIDETKETNDKKAITAAYNSPERMFSEIAQNAKDAKSRNHALINVMDAMELRELDSSAIPTIYNIVANDGEQMSKNIMDEYYAQLPGKSTKKENKDAHGSYGYGSCYKFFQPTLTFAYDATNNCCYTAFTSPRNLLNKNDANYAPIVVKTIPGSISSILNFPEESFGFKPTLVSVFKNNKYLNPNFIVVNENAKKHYLDSPACSFETLDPDKNQIFAKVHIDLLNVLGVNHELALAKTQKYSKEAIDFTCFARVFDVEKVQNILNNSGYNINYDCLTGTKELLLVNQILADFDFTAKYRFYRKDDEHFTVMIFGFGGTLYVSPVLSSVIDVQYKNNTEKSQQFSRKVKVDKRFFNGLYRAYKGHPCINNKAQNDSLFLSTFSDFSLPKKDGSQNVNMSDFIRVIINDDTLQEDINRANFSDESCEQKNYFLSELNNLVGYLKNDFSDIITAYSIPNHLPTSYIEEMEEEIAKEVEKFNPQLPNCNRLDAKNFCYISSRSHCSKGKKQSDDTLYEDLVIEDFYYCYARRNLPIKEKFANPTMIVASKKCNIDRLGIDYSKALVDKSEKELYALLDNPREYTKTLKYLQKEYLAKIEFEGTLSHFFEHGHSCFHVTHLITGDINGFELNKEYRDERMGITYSLTKNTKSYAKARYILTIKSLRNRCCAPHTIDVLNLYERIGD